MLQLSSPIAWRRTTYYGTMYKGEDCADCLLYGVQQTKTTGKCRLSLRVERDSTMLARNCQIASCNCSNKVLVVQAPHPPSLPWLFATHCGSGGRLFSHHKRSNLTMIKIGSTIVSFTRTRICHHGARQPARRQDRDKNEARGM